MLINNMLDALDRLFDCESSVIDTLALLFATSLALRDSPWFDALNQPVSDLRVIVQSNAAPDEKRISALCATDQLRKCLASIDGIH